MGMTRKDFIEVADALSDAKAWAEYDNLTLEEFRQMIGKRLRTVCHMAHSGGGSFNTSRFNEAAQLDD